MNDITKETRGNPKLIWPFGALIVACAALAICEEMTPKPEKVKSNDPQSYLKNCALKTALERPRS
jgi:hypothetical protein